MIPLYRVKSIGSNFNSSSQCPVAKTQKKRLHRNICSRLCSPMAISVAKHDDVKKDLMMTTHLSDKHERKLCPIFYRRWTICICPMSNNYSSDSPMTDVNGHASTKKVDCNE